MPLSDRIRRLEAARRGPGVEVWATAPDGMLRNTRTGERRRRDELGDLVEVMLTIDRTGEDAPPWD